MMDSTINDALLGSDGTQSQMIQILWVNVCFHLTHLTFLKFSYLSPTGPEGMEKFCQDIGVEPENVVMLVLAYKMNARQMGFFTQSEWMRGFTELQWLVSIPMNFERCKKKIICLFCSTVIMLQKCSPS